MTGWKLWLRGIPLRLLWFLNRRFGVRFGRWMSDMGASVFAIFLLFVSFGPVDQQVSWFAVSAIKTEGLRHVAKADFLAHAGVKIGDSLFDVSVREIRQNLRNFGWIEDVAVRRDWSGVVHFRVQERTPYALWRSSKGLFLIDREGTVIEVNPKHRFADLPLISGEGAHVRASVIITMINDRPLPQYGIHSLFFVSARRWDVHLRGEGGDFILRLPEKNVEAAWQRFIDAQNKHGFLNSQIMTVDMRTPGRLVIGLDEVVPKSRNIPTPNPGRSEEQRRL